MARIMNEKEFEEKLDLILLKSMLLIQEIEEKRRREVNELFDEFLNQKKNASSYFAPQDK